VAGGCEVRCLGRGGGCVGYMRMGVCVGGGLHLQVIETGKYEKNNSPG